MAFFSIQQYYRKLLQLNTAYQTAQFWMHHRHTGTGCDQVTLLISAHVHTHTHTSELPLNLKARTIHDPFTECTYLYMYMCVFMCITVTSLQSGSPVSVYNRDHAVKVGLLQHSGGCRPAVGSHNLFLYLLFLEVQESEALSHKNTRKHTQNYFNI